MIIEDAGIEKGNNMRILYFSQFYTPESIAPSFRAAENSKIWTNSGHEVTVFTGYPNYPTGKIFSGYTPKLISREKINGVNVVRSKLIAKPNTSTLRRLENGLSYFFFGMINILFNNSKIGKGYDVILGTSGVIFNALLAQIYAKLYKVPFVFEIRDITYIQMQATGKDEDDVAVKVMRKLELLLCRKAKRVVVVTNGFKKVLVEDGIDEEKVEVITNGVDVNVSAGAYDEGKKFILGYFGTLGVSQNIVDTFDYGLIIGKLVKDFKYLIIGDGAQRTEIVQLAKTSMFIEVLPGMPSEELEPYYCDIQMSVITLRKTDKFKYTIPSKLFQIMGRGIAVLFIGPEGEAADIIRENHSGIVLTGTKEEDLRILKDFFMQPDWKKKIREMGINGRKAVERQYSRTRLAKAYIKILRNVSKEQCQIFD